MTPLMLAAGEGHNAKLLRLLRAGADVNATDIHGSTALDWAVEEGHTQAVCLLLSAWAHVEGGAGVHVGGCDGDTPLQVAVQNGHADIVKMLVHAGADVMPVLRL